MPFEIKTVSTLLAFAAISFIISIAFATASSTIDAIVPTIVAAAAVTITYTTARALIPRRVPPSS